MNSTAKGFVREDPWRIFRIIVEFVDSFETLCKAGAAMTLFGSARTRPADPLKAIHIIPDHHRTREVVTPRVGKGIG